MALACRGHRSRDSDLDSGRGRRDSRHHGRVEHRVLGGLPRFRLPGLAAGRRRRSVRADRNRCRRLVPLNRSMGPSSGADECAQPRTPRLYRGGCRRSSHRTRSCRWARQRPAPGIDPHVGRASGSGRATPRDLPHDWRRDSPPKAHVLESGGPVGLGRTAIKTQRPGTDVALRASSVGKDMPSRHWLPAAAHIRPRVARHGPLERQVLVVGSVHDRNRLRLSISPGSVPRLEGVDRSVRAAETMHCASVMRPSSEVRDDARRWLPRLARGLHWVGLPPGTCPRRATGGLCPLVPAIACHSAYADGQANPQRRDPSPGTG